MIVTCKEIEQNLIARLENTLPEDQRLAIDAHLRDCADCRELFAQYQSLFTADKLGAAVPASLWRAVQARINELEADRRPTPAFGPLRRPAFGITLQALGVAVAIVAGVMLGRTPQTTTTTTATETDELIEYYASGFSTSSLLLDEVYEQVDNGNGGSR